MKPTTSGDSCRPAFLSHYEFLDAPIDRFGEFFANDITPDRDRSAFIVDRSPTFSIASENLPDLVETPTESEPDRQPELSRTETLESFVVSGARPRPGTGGLFQMTSKTDNPIADPVKLDVGGIFGANPPENHSALCSCVACALPAVRKPGGNDGPEIQGTPSTFSLALAAPPLDLSRTFFLNSLSGANHTIYLDFTGHTTTGTFWNTSARPTITTPAFDLDGNTAFFSAVEQERIQYIWQRVAEDFSPFNVNVTTQSPTNSGDLINSGAGDTRWGVRVAIGGSSSDWFGGGAGGVAYVNSFNWNTDTPAFVFTSNLANDEKYIAEAISHEAGHTLGLGHDGRISPSEGYYGGQGSGETGWGTIMGVGYYRNLTQWSRGQYNSANNTEDDLAIITTRNGFGYRVDDTGNSIAAARALTVSGTTVSGSGIIERNTDVDFFSFTTGAGAINLTVNPFSRGPNLDILAQLYNSSGVLVASSNPTDFLSATISTTLNAGTYYLAIDGVGKGDPLTTGYTDYGSLGQYFIGGNVIAPSGGDAAAVSFALSASTVTEDGTANLLYTFTRNGSLANPLTVNYTVGGTATNGTDYTAIGTSVTFAAGASTATVTIDPTADTLLESDETVALTLASGTGYSIATPGAVTGTIANDDYRPIESNGNTAFVADGADRFYARVGNGTPVPIRYQGQQLYPNFFAGWETLAAENLNGTNRVLWRNASQNVVHLWTTDANWNWVSSDGSWALNSSDAWARENEFGVDVNNDGSIGAPAAAVSLALSASTVIEDGTANLLYTLTRNGSLANPLTVNYTVGGTATNGTDYTAIGTSVTFAAGASTATVTIDPTADTLLESDETVALTLASGTGYSIATPGAVTGTIANDDYRPIESNGNTALLLDGADRFYTRTGANAPVAIRFQGQPLTVNYFAGWETLAAENLNGTNRVLWRNASQNVVHLWTTDANWNWVSSDGTWGLNSSDAWARENEFGVDVNNDGGIGAPSVGTEANDTLIGNGIANFLDGRGGNDLLTGGGDKDRLTGGTESDRFDYRVLTDSLIANFDAVTDFTATAGNDLFLVSSARSTFTDAGTAATLDASGIGAILTAGTFTANAAARFSFGSRTFAAINDATAGFNAATDAVIEVTGITGTLSLSNFTTV